jgi:hypothetical protein
MAPRQGCNRAAAQRLALRGQTAFFHDLARNRLDAAADGFVVYVQTDRVNCSPGVLQVSFLSWRFLRQSEHRSRSENPSSFHLCIPTAGTSPVLGELELGVRPVCP